MVDIAVRNDPVSAGASSTQRQYSLPGWLRRHPELWVALILVVASHLFVVTFATVARWQFAFPYHRTVDFCRWDCGDWFRTVIDEGYDRSPHRQGGMKANWIDFPLFPLSAIPLRLLRFRSTAASLIYAGKIELYAAVIFFLWMVREQLHDIAEYFMAGALIAFNPYLIYGHAGYSEPLYFALAALAFFLLKQNRWTSAGIAGALLSATRMVGCLFALAYLVVCWRKFGVTELIGKRNLTVLIGLLLCPLGLILYMLYLHRHTGDALGFLHMQIAWNRTVGNPFIVLVRSLQQHGWPRVWAITALAGLAATAWLFKAGRPELGFFLAGAILIPLCADTWCMPRYVWWQPPFLYTIFIILKRHRSWWPVYGAFAGGMASLMVILWFSGSAVVI